MEEEAKASQNGKLGQQYERNNELLLQNFLHELKNDSYASTQEITRQNSGTSKPETPNSLAQRFTRWLLSKGSNGGKDNDLHQFIGIWLRRGFD